MRIALDREGVPSGSFVVDGRRSAVVSGARRDALYGWRPFSRSTPFQASGTSAAAR